MDSRRPWSRSAVAIGVGLGVGSALALLAYELLRRNRHAPLSLSDWTAAQTESGCLLAFESLVERIARHGVAADARNYVWPYLLELYKPEYSARLIDERIQSLRTEYKRLLDRCEELDFEHREYCSRQSPGQRNDRRLENTKDAPHSHFAIAQQVILMDAIRTSFPEPPAKRSRHCPGGNVPSEPRQTIKDALNSTDHLSAGQKNEALRLVHLLCAYAVQDPEIGYCQGMTDLALPFVVAIRDDATAFSCFVKFMQSARPNFMHDGVGVKDQLHELSQVLEGTDAMLVQKLKLLDCAECYFAYRMLLVMLRRELSLCQASMLWEIMWADNLLKARQKPQPPRSESSRNIKPVQRFQPLPNLLVFVLAAAVVRQRRTILHACKSADDVMALFATQKIQLWPTLQLALQLRRRKMLRYQ